MVFLMNMSTVPPLPSNYWQRAGRAGCRHRMAVNLTFRTHSHDRPYFNYPLKLLEGEIAPPSFNLRNEVMVRKHVHAVVLTAMHRLSRPDSALSANDQVELADVLHAIFPSRVREYLPPVADFVSLRRRPLWLEHGWTGEVKNVSIRRRLMRQSSP